MQAVEEIESFIAEVTTRLKGPMSNLERALLVADRKDAREDLAKLKRHDLLRRPIAAPNIED